MRGGLGAHLDPLDWYQAATDAGDRAAACAGLGQTFRRLGADTYGIVDAMPLRLGAFPDDSQMSGFFVTEDWHRHYRANQHLIRDDPFARRLFTSRRLHYIDLDDPRSFPVERLNAAERRLLRLVVDFGMRQSLGVSFVDPRSGRISIAMINRVAGGSGDLAELTAHHGAALHLALQVFFEGLRIREMAESDPPGRLSMRERDCLQWAALGRTTQQIADALGLNDHTVNEYFASAMRKLEAANRTQAVVRALALGLISP